MTNSVNYVIIVSDETITVETKLSERIGTAMTEAKKRSVTKILREIKLFGTLSDTELCCLAERSELKKYASGEYIDRPIPCLPVIISGQAAVLGKNSEKNSVILRLLKSGSVFGVSGLFSDEEERISLIRAEKATEALLIPQSVISELIHKNGDFAEAYIRLLGAKIRYLGSKVEAFTAGSAEAKLAKHLVTLISAEDRSEGEQEITLECSLSRLADMLNIGRASLYRAIDSLTEKGFITHSDRRITVKDLDSLEKWAKAVK